MVNIFVEPADGSSGGLLGGGGDGWQVTGRGQKSTHNTKSAAKNEAERRAKEGDKLYIYTASGSLQNKRVVGGSGDEMGSGGLGLGGDLGF